MSPTLIIAILLVLAYLCFLLKSSKYDRKLPPGPIALPIVGNLHKLGTLPHRNLQKLAQKYGPIMSMRLGTVTAIVISSPQAASLFLKTHDINFANRPKLIASDYLTYGTKGIGFLEYGPYWRNIRKICIQKLLSSSKTESFAGLRKKEIGLMVQSLKESAAIGEVVDISRKISEVVGDIATMMILGKKKDDRYDLKGHAKEVLNLIGTFNLADYVTYFRALDLQGLTRRMKKTKKLMDEVLEKILIEHEQDTNNHKSGDFIDALLELLNKPINPQGEHVYIIDRTNIKGLLIELIMAAFDTSSTTIDWTISQLIRNPRVMKKLQNELHSVIGMDRMVEEKDLGKLGYLDMVVKESFRLHPVAPLLVPRESKEDTTIEGYCIPKKSRIIVNVWAIGHDQNVWSKNVEEFYPERFIEKNINVHGHEFELIPFGSGRRICAGIQMGLITVKLVLAQLVHCFDWELPSGIKPADIDMTEIFGLSVPRANHLLLKPTNRLLNKTE